MAATEPYKIEGSYYEACNCEAICPCRRQNGAEGGLSTYGNCDFILSWAINNGHLGDVDLSDTIVCMAGTYHDDEVGSPWSISLYLHEDASDAQYEALEKIFLGKAGGNILFTENISKVLGVQRAKISLSHAAGKEEVEITNIGGVSVDRVFDFDGTVSCGIPGHDFPGQESVSSFTIDDGPLQFAYKERCGFSTEFSYWG